MGISCPITSASIPARRSWAEVLMRFGRFVDRNQLAPWLFSRLGLRG